MAVEPDMDSDNWVSIRHLQHIAAHGEAAGFGLDAVLRETDVTRAQLADADARIPLATLESMLEIMARYQDTTLLGLELAGDIQPATFGLLGHLAQACGTFADVLDVMTRYNGLLSNIGHTALAHGPGTVSVCWQCRAGGVDFRRRATEYVLGAFAVLARFLMPEQGDFLLASHFNHPRPAHPGHSRAYFRFFRAPVHFDRQRAALVLPARLLDVRMHHGDARLKELLERHAADQLQRRRQDLSLPDAVRHLIAAMLADGLPTKDSVAVQLGLSGRSLHRRLQQAGTSYRDILHAVRRELADRHLRDGMPSAAIADRLGFSGRQAFLRWFRQDTGQTPGEYKQARSQP